MAESWTITPSEGVTNNNNGTFVFPKNTGCTDIVYTIDYTDASGCTGTTTYTIPKHEDYDNASVWFKVSPDHGASSVGGSWYVSSYSSSSDLTVVGAGWAGSYASGILKACNDYSLSITFQTNYTKDEIMQQCTDSWDSSCTTLFMAPYVDKGNFVIEGTPSYNSYYSNSCTLVDEDAKITIDVEVIYLDANGEQINR